MGYFLKVHFLFQVIEELAALLQTPKDKIETTVHESKCDDLSAMFNMMLHSKRFDRGKNAKCYGTVSV